jgi:hypothetical protein
MPGEVPNAQATMRVLAYPRGLLASAAIANAKEMPLGLLIDIMRDVIFPINFNWLTRIFADFGHSELSTEYAQKKVRDKHDRDMSVPAIPGTAFIVVKPKFVFAFLKTLFDRPPPEREFAQLIQSSIGRCVAQRVFHFWCRLPI